MSAPDPRGPAPLDAELVAARFAAERTAERRVAAATTSGIRLVVLGLALGAAAALGNIVLPPTGFWVFIAGAEIAAALAILFGVVRLVAAAVLARRARSAR